MHWWGDEWNGWNDLTKAHNYIHRFVRRWSGCYLMSKEKYGTIRYEHIFPPYGSMYYRNKLHRWWLNSWIYYKWCAYGKFILSIAIKRAAKKYPKVKEEILEDWDGGDYL
jgi:hypothetical protein